MVKWLTILKIIPSIPILLKGLSWIDLVFFFQIFSYIYWYDQIIIIFLWIILLYYCIILIHLHNSFSSLEWNPLEDGVSSLQWVDGFHLQVFCWGSLHLCSLELLGYRLLISFCVVSLLLALGWCLPHKYFWGMFMFL